MKKHLYFLFSFFFPILLLAQNVGIGNPTPNEKLDVTGNINVTGTIKVNGVDGNPNQVLMKNSTGNFSWGNIGDFKSLATFTDTATANIVWNVPANTTKIWVELWGGGGAGLDAGGGGGGYMSLLFDVVPTQSMLLTAGKGGKDAVTVSSATFKFNQSGSGSRIDIAGNTFIANAGNGSATSTAFSFPQYLPGTAGTYFTFVPATTSPRGPFYTQAGQDGSGYKQEYQAVGTNQYFLHKLYGHGGAGANTANYTSQPSIETFSIVISPASTIQTAHSVSRPGVFPGGGGAGGSGFVNDGRGGANGLILIHY